MLLFTLNLDPSSIVIIIFTAIIGLTSTIAGNRIKNYFKRIEKAALVRERKQESYYMKLDAIVYALAISSDSISSQTFNKAYNDKLAELERERNRLEGDI